MPASSHSICTLILAGGRGSRMQHQDKGLIEWRGKPLIEHCLSHVKSDCVMISANRNIERYQRYGYPVIEDELSDFQGPLAGLLAAMHRTDKDYILMLPCDSPEPPTDLQSKLFNCMQQQQAHCAICNDGQRLQPLFSLIATQYQHELADFLHSGQRKVGVFFDSINPAICDFSNQAKHFYNFNRVEDLL